MQPFRSILFAADFSKNSLEAFRVACSLALENKTRLIVLHVVEPNWVPIDPIFFGHAAVQFLDAGRDQAYHTSLARHLCEVYAPSHAIDVAYQTREGDPATEILKLAEESGCDLIVMGTHGHTGVRWLLAGSVATAVLRKAHCPVLALRSFATARRDGEIRVILHPTDFSEYSASAAPVARTLARDLGARLVIVHITALPILIDGTPTADADSEFYMEELEQMRKRLDGPDLKYPIETRIAGGFPPEGTLQIADETAADLIVMGTHGRTGLVRTLTGSVAESVMHKADCPVMVVRAAASLPAAAADRPASEAMTVY